MSSSFLRDFLQMLLWKGDAIKSSLSLDYKPEETVQ